MGGPKRKVIGRGLGMYEGRDIILFKLKTFLNYP